MALIDDIEKLAERITALREAEELAIDINRQMLPELRKLHYASLKSLNSMAKRLLRGRISLGGKPPKIPIEFVERLFVLLRDQAEMEWTRSLKLSGSEQRKSKVQADKLARLAHQAAVSLKIVAESRGIWNDKYVSEHGLDAWL
jgi:hypothetical protein